jgi:hypothetical protein
MSIFALAEPCVYPDWSDSELGRLGHRMQRHVLDGIAKRELVERRLRW